MNHSPGGPGKGAGKQGGGPAGEGNEQAALSQASSGISPREREPEAGPGVKWAGPERAREDEPSTGGAGRSSQERQREQTKPRPALKGSLYPASCLHPKLW